MDETTTMSLAGEIVEVYEEGLVDFKVRTKLGFAYVWVWDEVMIIFQEGMNIQSDELPITFSDGQPVAVVRPGYSVWLDGVCYTINDPEHVIS
jgi:hypothetical protein